MQLGVAKMKLQALAIEFGPIHLDRNPTSQEPRHRLFDTIQFGVAFSEQRILEMDFGKLIVG